MLNRRGFLKLFGATVGGVVLGEAIPFNRVWSFPKKIVIAQPLAELGIMEPVILSGAWWCSAQKLVTVYYDKEAVKNLQANRLFERVRKSLPVAEYSIWTPGDAW